jgi:hypothetical protein
MVVQGFIDGTWYADNCTEVERKVLTNDSMQSDFVTAEIYFTMEVVNGCYVKEGPTVHELTQRRRSDCGGVRSGMRVNGKKRRALWMNVDVEIQLETARR